MKRSEMILRSILVPLDFIMIALAAFTAYRVRFGSVVEELRPAIYYLPPRQFLPLVLISAVLLVILFAIAGLYQMSGRLRLTREFSKVFLATSTGVMIVIILFFFNRNLFSSRFIVLGSWILIILYVMIARSIMRLIQLYQYRRGWGVHGIVIVGDHPMTQSLISDLTEHPLSGYRIVEKFSAANGDLIAKLERLLSISRVDELFQTDPSASRADILKLLEFCEERNIIFKYAADLYNTRVSNIAIEPVAGIPMIEIRRTPLDGWGRILKRLFDLVVSAVLIIICLPIMLVVAIAIKLDSRGPIFFSRRDGGDLLMRVGAQGELFRYYKFRSMKVNTDSLRYSPELQGKNIRAGSPMVKIKDDPRITRVGKWIRRYSLDEFAELFLVFLGRMSLVGPRPHLPEEVAKYQKHHKAVLKIKPGMTGLAQVSGRSDLDFEEEIRLDNYYIENWSLWLDLRLLLQTPGAVLRKRSTL
jgi:exopolysaccharide biosynthesis polyprenyl glycosylphosphotransferase